MNKPSPVLILLGVVVLALIGYTIYDQFKPSSEKSNKKIDDNILDVQVKVDSLPKDPAEAYKEKWKRENALARKVDNEENFFATEVKKKPFEDTVKKDDFFQQEEERKATEKPKVVIKYIEKKPNLVEQESQSVVIPAAPETKRRTKKGFATDPVNQTTSQVTTSSTEFDFSVPVVIQESVEVKSGSSVILRTIEGCQIGEIQIPQNTLLNSVASVSQNRILLTVKSFKVGTKFVTTELTAYGIDGAEGILVEGDVDQQIRKDVTNEAISTAQRAVNVPILSNVPIRAGRKKLQDTSVPLEKGHELILKKK